MKICSYRERLQKLGLTSLLERVDLGETFIFHGISNFPRVGNLLFRQISKTKSTNQLDFFANRVIYFQNKLPNLIKKTAIR